MANGSVGRGRWPAWAALAAAVAVFLAIAGVIVLHGRRPPTPTVESVKKFLGEPLPVLEGTEVVTFSGSSEGGVDRFQWDRNLVLDISGRGSDGSDVAQAYADHFLQRFPMKSVEWGSAEPVVEGVWFNPEQGRFRQAMGTDPTYLSEYGDGEHFVLNVSYAVLEFEEGRTTETRFPKGSSARRYAPENSAERVLLLRLYFRATRLGP